MNQHEKAQDIPVLADGKVYKNVYEFTELSKIGQLEEPVLVYGNGLPFTNMIYAFADEESMLNWADGTKFGKKWRKIVAQRKEAQKLEHADHKAAMQIAEHKTAQFTKRVEELAERTGLEIGSEELFKLACVNPPLLEGEVFDPIFMFGEWDYRGRFRPLWAGWHPNLGWLGFNNQLSSCTIFGTVVLYDGTWWRGRQLWLTGLPIFRGFPEFFSLGFDNRASSAIHF